MLEEQTFRDDAVAAVSVVPLCDWSEFLLNVVVDLRNVIYAMMSMLWNVISRTMTWTIDDTAEEEEPENVDLVAVVCDRFSVPTRLSFAGSRSTLSLKTLARSAFARILNSSSSSSSVCIVSPLRNTTVTSVCVRPQCRRARSSAAPYLFCVCVLF